MANQGNGEYVECGKQVDWLKVQKNQTEVIIQVQEIQQKGRQTFQYD